MIKRKHKILNIFLSVCICMASILAYSTNSFAKEDLNGPDVSAEGYCVIDADTGEVIIQKNMNLCN